ncbi:MAG: PLP-dependent aminotransferase family protein [Bacteroidales bacterium]|nr:PLP-dependent aminotransferase family protein [Bacteroidales bacterium]MDD3665632.1 PLP-dependent aminotransferase family protein [Bacteroidales bacterium]
MEIKYSSCSGRTSSSEIRELLKYTRLKGVISFAGGLPDPSLFPNDQIVRITKDVMETKGLLALQYGPTPGEGEFIEALQSHMRHFGEEASADQIVVTSSSQQGLDLLALTLLDPGDEIVVELPSYLGALQAFGRSGARMNGIPLGMAGMPADKLEELIKRKQDAGTPIRFIYVIPDFQNPSGVVMSLENRMRLLDISQRYQVPVVEDSPYREIRFTGAVMPSLWTLSGGNGVIQLKTFSKMLFPGMRLGWIVANSDIANKMALMKQSVDLCTPTFNQLIIAQYINEGLMKSTIARAVDLYRQKSGVMIAALEKHMPDYVKFTRPEGGMFLWVTLPEGADAKAMVEEAAANGVVYVTGRPFHCNGEGANTLRLNYSYPSNEQIETGIARLANTIRNYCEAQGLHLQGAIAGIAAHN